MYQPSSIEPKWQKYWAEHSTFAALNPPFAGEMPPKAYILDMFPYPSGAGLHVGHPKGYTATDVYSRYLKGKGFNVMHTMGWDAFGLPAENYAIKTGQHPGIITQKNIGVFKKQIQSLGLAYDWSREVDTTDPSYYKWTQWIFTKLFERGLAYEQDLPINYCPSCKTGLANEEVLADNTCDRCGAKVERRKLRQWVLKITAYADRLLADVDGLDWPEGIKEQQRNWIGKSEGCEFRMKKVDDDSVELSVYTTRIDTVYGMTYAVIAPDHADIAKWIASSEAEVCQAYIAESKSKSDQDRMNDGKEKTGVFTGSYVINPFNNEEIPVFIGDYVLGSYGTGAVMAVPAHDERDFEFAKKMDLPIIKVIASKNENTEYMKLDEELDETKKDARTLEILARLEEIENVLEWDVAFTEEGFLIKANGHDEEFLDTILSLDSATARGILAEKAENEGFGTKKVNYKLRDWLFSRQRYWGEPIPLIHLDIEDLKKLPHISDITEAKDAKLAYILKREPKADEVAIGCDGNCNCACSGKVWVLVIGGKEYSKIYDGLYSKIICDSNLPLELPEVENYEPAGDGNSPLANVPSFVNVTLADNLTGKRETNTMPQWAGSCWYYLRYMDSKNPDALASKEALEYWKSIDCYVGGAEHAVLHLLYARFWHKFLFDIGAVPTSEPFQKLINQGLILGPDGNKMSKSKGNVINPDDLVREYGADTLRAYILSMADFRDAAPWDSKAIVGISRFLERAEALFGGKPRLAADEMKVMKLMHKSIKKISADIEAFKFNTAISTLIIMVNEGLPADTELANEWKSVFARLLHPFAPHLAEELWEKLGNTESVYLSTWPEYDEFMTVDDEVVIAIQVNGKLRATREFLNGVSQEEVVTEAYNMPEVSKWTEGKTVVREIFIPNKLLNIVVKE